MFSGYRKHTPSETVNAAIDVTPEEYLASKPHLLHLQLSDIATKKLNKVARKTGLSQAALIERAVDYAYRKSMMAEAKRVAANIADIVANKATPFHARLVNDLPDLITKLMPFHTSFDGRECRWNLLPFRTIGTEEIGFV